jgi:cellobiose phosphorylase
VIPASWPGFTVTRRFRGATYRISVRKPVGLTGRVVELLVDGVRVNGNVVPPAIPDSIVEVDAVVRSELVAAS